MNPNDNRLGGSGGPEKDQQQTNDNTNTSSSASDQYRDGDQSIAASSSDMSLFSLLFTGLDTTTTSLPTPLWPGEVSSSSTLPHYMHPPLLSSSDGLNEDDNTTSNATMNVINRALALVDGIEESLSPSSPSHAPSSQASTLRRLPYQQFRTNGDGRNRDSPPTRQ